MKGQIWSELVFAFLVLLVYTITFVSIPYGPFVRSVRTAVAYSVAVDEVVRQEVSDLRDYSIEDFNVSSDMSYLIVRGNYGDRESLENILRDVMNELSPNTRVVVE